MSDPKIPDFLAIPDDFVGWDHPRYDEWKFAVDQDHTLLGLAAWLEANPEEGDTDEVS